METVTRKRDAARDSAVVAIPALVVLCLMVVIPFFLSLTVAFKDYTPPAGLFGSPWVGAYFDVGNIMAYGYPEQWIVSLGRRIRKIHVKGFKIEDRTWCSLLASSIDWAAVMRAFRQVGYDDVMTGELAGAGDTPEARMTNISTDMDKILAM